MMGRYSTFPGRYTLGNPCSIEIDCPRVARFSLSIASPLSLPQKAMDGKGRYAGNIFLDRLWRTAKYEDVFLKPYASAGEART